MYLNEVQLDQTILKVAKRYDTGNLSDQSTLMLARTNSINTDVMKALGHEEQENVEGWIHQFFLGRFPLKKL
ncbi:hypothetical protein [Paenibacillus hubeiensis]|uniref:hypothetical protein n=1 Tax=Paenibacillus hubeiensis TaxID=3077330 RepID=UPI0031BB7BAF